MNSFQLKIIAIVTMVIDHLGLFFFPQYIIFRLIGRIAFPLFAWLIANGAYHTHNIGKYLQRLYVFALLAQIPFLLPNRLIDPQFSNINVLCTLFFGLAAIVLIQRTKKWIYWLLISVVFCSLAQFLQTDYGGFGVAVVILFYVFYYNFKKMVIAQFILFFVPLFLFNDFGDLVEPFGLISLFFIHKYNNQRGPSAKYLFYIFYPLQYVIFYLLLLGLLAKPI